MEKGEQNLQLQKELESLLKRAKNEYDFSYVEILGALDWNRYTICREIEMVWLAKKLIKEESENEEWNDDNE